MLKYAAKTDVGNQRENNEDCYLACPEICLWIMADGVGGQDAGEVASQIACSVIKSQVAEGDGLDEAINVAHRAIKQSFQQGIGKPGMASTVVVLRVYGAQYQVAWVGDSRAYLWRAGTLMRLTRDQSLVQRLVDEKIISEEEALHHPRRNLVIQALGQENLSRVEVEAVIGDFNDGDKILLCSDGLTDYVTEEKIAECFLQNHDDKQLVEKLVSAALATEGKDNITVLAIDLSTQNINETGKVNLERQLNKQEKKRAWWLISATIGLFIIGILVVGFSVL